MPVSISCIYPKKHLVLAILLLFLAACGNYRKLPAAAQAYSAAPAVKDTLAPYYYGTGDNRLRKNEQGIWELYIAGSPLDRGLAAGSLTKELLYKQEAAFVAQIRELVPSTGQQKFLRSFLRFFNRDLADHVPEEYKAEIYGISRYTTDSFNFIAPPYFRMLYFHAAHDIGHALQDLALVGCTSFAAWGNSTEDGKLLIGRNFDFYAGDAFSEEKMILFIAPDSGYKHAMVTWAGMIGTVSGMNEAGLTITINAGKSSIPLKARTPISLLAREILQYASTIEEAATIADKRKVFVAESMLVGSAEDGQAALIEVAPKKLGIYMLNGEQTRLICTNHFQSSAFRNDRKNNRHMQESHSVYRYQRIRELMTGAPPLTPALAADFLRNRAGLHNSSIGLGNEKAINQLMAHHAVIFKPEERLMWVSARPYQLGAFVAYDLKEVFRTFPGMKENQTIALTRLNIPEDTLVHSVVLQQYAAYRALSRQIREHTKNSSVIAETVIARLEQLNPDYWETYAIIGEYYLSHKAYHKALSSFRMASVKEITTLADKKQVEKRIKKCERKVKHRKPPRFY